MDHVFFSNGTNHSRGVAVMIANHVHFNVESVIEGFEGRALLINATIEKCKVCLVKIYAPTEKKFKESFFKRLNTWIKENRKKRPQVDYCGRLELMDAKCQRRNYYKTPQNVKKLIKEHVLCDAWRTLNPKRKQFTWRNLTLNIASRLDYFMIDKHFLCNVLSCDIRPLLKYDHNAVSFKLALDRVEKGPGFWKLNTQVLKEPDYQNNIRNIIVKNKANKYDLYR